MPLRTLANRCGLSINAISRIERGENSPTVFSLHRLSIALNVPITAFFREEADETIIFVRGNERLRHQMNGMVLQSLGSGLSQQQLEPFLITIEPSTSYSNHPVTHHGEEFVYCLEGKFEYCVNDRVYPMLVGDSLIFKATQPHYWNNPSETLAKAILVFQASQAQHLLRQPAPGE